MALILTIFSWAQRFVDETLHLQRNGEKILFITDGYACYTPYHTFALLTESGIIVAGLSAHTNNVRQPLDVSVVRPLKEEFKRLLSLRTVTPSSSARHDIITICELLTRAYYYFVNPQNAIADLERPDFDIWKSLWRIFIRSFTKILHH